MFRLWLIASSVYIFAIVNATCSYSAASEPRVLTEADRSHWAFQAVRLPAPPIVQDLASSRNPIDGFILKELDEDSIVPSAEADRTTLIRRATLDLTGLLPTLEQIDAFIEDKDPNAFQRVIDRLLASPRYGERWGRHWLDLAMYAESSGFEQDETRPNAWRYRDYVVAAFNADKPYDRFVTEQIAGDEAWPDEMDARIATAFMRHYPEEGNNKDILLARQEILHHITDVVGATFLGLTFNCAQCHDHKYDPILQKDYYRLQAFFANIGHNDKIPIASESELRAYEESLAEYERQTDALWTEMDELLATVRKYSPRQLLARYPDYVIEAMAATPSSRSPLQAQIAHILNNKDCGTCPQRPKPHSDPFFDKDAKALKGDAKARYEELKAQLARVESLKPRDIQRTMGITDISDSAPPTHVLGVGLYTAPKEIVQPGFLSLLDPEPAMIRRLNGRASTGRRSTLASWLVDRRNPLTSRVMVNRIWHYHFGRGIVGTPSDFGVAGDSPTHPELLDWLASHFMDCGWSVKEMHRTILSSATYRQKSDDRPDVKSDPRNRLLWRFPPQRLDGESIRDIALQVSGLLNQELGGPSVFPPLPQGRPIPVGGWKVSSKAADHGRRSVYIFVRRNDRYPMLEAFDFPDSHESCACRNQTTTAPQALTLLNSELSAAWSGSFARRVVAEVGDDCSRQAERAFHLANSRLPDDWELRAAVEFLNRQSKIIDTERSGRGEPGKGDVDSRNAENAAARQEALADYCLMLLNSNEFLFTF